MKMRILPAIAALAAAIAKPFKRKPKKTTFEVPLLDLPSRGHVGTRAPTLRGNGKAARALRKARRRYIAGSFSRLLAHKPMGPGVIDERGAAWRKVFKDFVAHMDAKSDASSTVRLGRRGQKRAARLARKREVRIMRKAKRELAAVNVDHLRRLLEVTS